MNSRLTAATGPARDPIREVLAAIDEIERRSYYASRVDWVEARRKASAGVAASPGAESVHAQIRSVLDELGDRHSFLVSADEAAQLAKSCDGYAEVRRDREDVGYVRLDGFFGGHRPDMDAFAAGLHGRIDALADDGVAAWIVDLRRNRGGNMWPMLAALSGLIGTQRLGEFVDRDGTRETWDVEASVAVPGAINRHATSPVAVLIGEATASSGEAVALAFVGRDRSRLIGGPTKGLSSSNERIVLPDGAVLFLTTSVFADRSGKCYGGPILPDEVVSGDSAVFDAAYRWIAATR